MFKDTPAQNKNRLLDVRQMVNLRTYTHTEIHTRRHTCITQQKTGHTFNVYI